MSNPTQEASLPVITVTLISSSTEISFYIYFSLITTCVLMAFFEPYISRVSIAMDSFLVNGLHHRYLHRALAQRVFYCLGFYFLSHHPFLFEVFKVRNSLSSSKPFLSDRE